MNVPVLGCSSSLSYSHLNLCPHYHMEQRNMENYSRAVRLFFNYYKDFFGMCRCATLIPVTLVKREKLEREQ